jgi:hypothetical protein
MAKKRKKKRGPTTTPEEEARRAETQRMLEESIAYHKAMSELLGERERHQAIIAEAEARRKAS